MILETAERLRPLARDDELLLVIGREHQKETERLFRDRKVHILAEPVGRNTAPCIGLGAFYATRLGASEPLVFLPADHFIGREEVFVEAIRRAAELAVSGAIVTLGIVPTRPETGYGYIRRTENISAREDVPAFRVEAFVEKPDLDKARQYVAREDYYWNAGIFVAKAETILRELETHLPPLFRGLKTLSKAMGTDAFEREMQAVYAEMEAISFDHGIMERTSCPLLVVPCECGWSDVGSWSSLYDLRKEEWDDGGNLKEGDCVLADCGGTFVSARAGRLVACLGLRDCLVVDTPDGLLVADRGRSQEIRKLIEQLKKEGREDLL